LAKHGLDFEDAPEVFAGKVANAIDERWDYGEMRNITAGFLRGRMVVLVWTLRGETRHIISMRYCHDREQRRWRKAGLG